MTGTKATHMTKLRALVASLDPTKATDVDPTRLILDQRLYPRASLDFARIGAMREVLQEGGRLPPIWVAKDGVTVIDGAHRTVAAREEHARLSALTLPISDHADIVLVAMIANTPSSPLPLRQEDLRRSLVILSGIFYERGLKSPKEWVASVAGTAKALAEAIGVSSYRLGKFLEELEGGGRRTLRAEGDGGVPPTVRKRDERGEPPSPWDESPALPPEVVKAALSVEPSIPEVGVDSPWQSVLGVTVRLLHMLRDVLGQDEAENVRLAAEAMQKMRQEDVSVLNEQAYAMLRRLAKVIADALVTRT